MDISSISWTIYMLSFFIINLKLINLKMGLFVLFNNNHKYMAFIALCNCYVSLLIKSISTYIIFEKKKNIVVFVG